MAYAAVAHGTLTAAYRLAVSYREISHRAVLHTKTASDAGITDPKFIGIVSCLSIEPEALA